MTLIADEFDAQPAVETRLLIDQIRARAEPVSYPALPSIDIFGNGAGQAVAIAPSPPSRVEPEPVPALPAPAPAVSASVQTRPRLNYAVIGGSVALGAVLGAVATWLLLR